MGIVGAGHLIFSLSFWKKVRVFNSISTSVSWQNEFTLIEF